MPTSMLNKLNLQACFLDIDGVFHDLNLLSDRWSELLGVELALLLGGESASWASANQATFSAVWSQRDTWRSTPLEQWQDEALGHLTAMCQHLGRQPPTVSEALGIMREVEVRTLRRGTALLPGARKTILELSSRYAVHMATGNLTWRIEALLQSLGVQDQVGLRSGPDLVGARKDTLLFYERAFQMAQVRAEDAVVIDDTALQIALATTVGARTVHVSKTCDGSCSADAHITTFEDLPEALQKLR